jgi:uncharacterized protein
VLASDPARGFMLLLIAMAYAPVYTTSGEAGGYGRRPGGSVLDQSVSFVSTLVVEYRAFPMFVFVGAGRPVGRRPGGPGPRCRRQARARRITGSSQDRRGTGRSCRSARVR